MIDLTSGLSSLREGWNARSREISLVFIAAAVLLAASIFFLDTGPVPGALFLTGIAGVCILSELTSLDSHIKADYLQTGEGFWAALLIFITARLITPALPLVLLLTWTGLFIMGIIFRIAYEPGKNQTLFIGILFNGAALLGVYYFFRHDPARAGDLAGTVASGFAGSGPGSLIYAAIAGAIIIIMSLLMIRLRPELSLLSQGSGEFSITGISYPVAVMILLAARSLVLTFVIAFTGWLGGTACYLLYMTGSRVRAFSMTVSLMCLMYIFHVLFGAGTAAVISVFLSYILYGIYSRLRGGVYDRD